MASVKTTHFTLISRGSKNIAVLTMDNAPVNSLSNSTRSGLVEGIKKALSDSSVVGVVVRGAGRAFCAGAEITEFAGSGSGSGGLTENLNDTLARFELASVPVVALVHGFALGGGCEVSLSCHYRVASEDTSFGLPEVNLGLLPGAGGTQRMPRLIGALPAAEMICSGSPVNAIKAKELGIVDLVIPKNLNEQQRLDAAVDFLLSRNGAVRPICNLPIPDAAQATDEKLHAVLKSAMSKRRGELAPQAIIACIRAAVKTFPNFNEGMKEEARLFSFLLKSPEARALQHQFFAERAAPKLSKEFSTNPLPFKLIGIVGAGLMGGGIAMSCVDNGLNVILLDATQEFLDKGMKAIKANYQRSVDRKSITAKKMEDSLSRIKLTLNYEDFQPCDIIVEAVFEDMKIKKTIFQKLDKVCRPGAILSSNTSALDIDEIASVTSRPQDVIGCHFFSPANVMRLLENVRGKKTSASTISTAMEFGKKIGKIPVLVGNCPGFVGNRMIAHYSEEAFKMVLEGVCYERIDRIAKDVIGMNMGPIAMTDLVGIDLDARQRKTKGIANPSNNLGDAMFEAGRYGQKNGKGFYTYGPDRVGKHDQFTDDLIKRVAGNLGIPQRPNEKVLDQEIMERLLFPLINEGFKCLEEGIAQKSSDIDIVYCYGYGFPKWRGGPMRFAEEIGLDSLLAGLRKYKRLGRNETYWEPSKLLVQKVVDQAHGKCPASSKL